MIEQIKQDQLSARKARDSFKAKLLTTVIGEATMPGKETDVVKVITKFIKNAREIESLGNTHQSVQATNEIKILEQYLPRQLSEEELTGLIVGMATYLDDMNVGTVMKELNKEYKGKFDSRLAVDIIRAST